ncbi:SCO family protein [Sulfuricurvum sp.]|uniref:SCO family protein n=1 Tax=Sulfuricurvum sp. TaxID=2025608 RepID=UPI002632FD6D|nr:SCO family protein [Sulfuricurvum sp.]MDD2267371.1 SCO family protein [Sulfuricurvum sp.]MDD2782715.1 SCO family protein [Sulfuricurvum sp.]
MNKKIVLAVVLFVVLLVAVPFIQALFFTQQTAGKIVINQPINAPYLNNTKKEITLVFFGYVGCVRVCTPILHQLNDFYDSPQFAPFQGTVGVSFVNLMPELDKNQPQLFAESFNHEFEGVYLTQKELMSIDRELNVFFSKSLSESGEIDHSDHLYLIEREKSGIVVLRNIYTTHPINRSLIVDDIRKLLSEKNE